MARERKIDLKILLFINLIIATGALTLKLINPIVVNYTEAIKKADILNFGIFTPLIMVILSIIVYRSLKPIRLFSRKEELGLKELQETRTAAFNLPLKITGQFLIVILSIVAFVALGWDAIYFRFYPFLDRLVSMGLIWAYTVCSSFAVFVYIKHKMLIILKETSGRTEDKGFRLPIKNRFIITTLTLSAMTFLFIFVYSFSRINDMMWHDEVQSGEALLKSFKKKTNEFKSIYELKKYINNKSLKQNLFMVNSEGAYITHKPQIIPTDFDIKNRVLTDPEGTSRIGRGSRAALKILPLEGPFEGLYTGTIIKVSSLEQRKMRIISMFFLIMGSFLLIFVVIISYYVANDTSMAVKDVTKQMIKISNKKEILHAEVKVTSLDEVGDMTRAFNYLQRIIDSYHQELDKTKTKLLNMERRRADDAVHVYRLLAENITDVIFTLNLNMRLTYVSPSVYRLRGYNSDESVTQKIEDWFTTDSCRTAEKAFLEAIKMANTDQKNFFLSQTLELEVVCKDGSTIWTEANINPLLGPDERPIGALYVLRDISDRKKMEDDMLKAQKLESLGILAGGIAHDFNNLLTIIIGNLSLMELFAKSGINIAKMVKETKIVSKQTKNLTQQLLTFSKGGEPVRKDASILKLLKDAVIFAMSGSNVQCELCASDDLWLVEIDEGQIIQVINNLIINAKQAMLGGGKIEVSAENIYVKSENGLPLEEGKYVKISIKDQGTGIPDEYRDKIFDPYFTTKVNGSGLGLAITYSIMKKHGGHITVKSEQGAGTIFHLYLPASDNKHFIIENILESKPHSGSGKVLLMDDQPEIRRMVGRTLSFLGYKVECVGNGKEAIILFRKAIELGKAFDAVILDLTIPGGMGGKETVQELRKIDPDVKAIVSSGYSNDSIMSDYTRYGFCGVVIKPYEINELSELLYMVINRNSKKDT